MTTTTKSRKQSKKAPKSGEALRKQVLAATAQRIDALDGKGKPAKAQREKPRRMGGLDCAAQVLKDAGKPMTCSAIMEAISTKKMWSTKGKTPEATISAAISREIAAKGKDARFKKVDRGQFSFNTAARKAGD